MCDYIYRIAGNIGGEKTLAVWRCKLKIVNIKSVQLKKYGTKLHARAQQQHLSLAQLQHIDQNHCLLFCTPVYTFL